MMRSRFDEQLASLNRELVTMGGLCEEVIAAAARALLEGDTAAEARVKPLEEEIDRAERDIEALCLRLLLQQQPVARDLRLVSAALKMITDMERIGDQAVDITEMLEYLRGHGGGSGGAVGEMARVVISMVTDSVDAFVSGDVTAAHGVMDRDDRVDALFAQVKRDLIDTLHRDPELGEFALDMLMVAKYFERIGNHATNIAEWVEFSITGVYKGGEVI